MILTEELIILDEDEDIEDVEYSEEKIIAEGYIFNESKDFIKSTSDIDVQKSKENIDKAKKKINEKINDEGYRNVTTKDVHFLLKNIDKVFKLKTAGVIGAVALTTAGAVATKKALDNSETYQQKMKDRHDEKSLGTIDKSLKGRMRNYHGNQADKHDKKLEKIFEKNNNNKLEKERNKKPKIVDGKWEEIKEDVNIDGKFNKKYKYTFFTIQGLPIVCLYNPSNQSSKCYSFAVKETNKGLKVYRCKVKLYSK